MFKAIFCIIVPLFLISDAQASTHSNNTPSVVKLSKSGICHDKNSSYFSRTKNATEFASIDSCLKAGGRPPKSKSRELNLKNTGTNIESGDYSKIYNRSEWPHWADNDKDCQNTRHEMLLSSSRVAVSFKTSKGCYVAEGEWYDPYTDLTFVDASSLDLDHLVPLKYANGRGGDKWSRAKKKEFANDIDNLILVDLGANRQKGAKGIDEWLPPNHSFRCQYIGQFDKVVKKYNLYYIPTEKRTVQKMLKACS